MGGASEWESSGIMVRAAGGAVHIWQWEQLDLGLGNSWTGEPGDGDGHGWVRLMGTRGCPGWHCTKLGPHGAQGGQSLPSHPQSSHRRFFSSRLT